LARVGDSNPFPFFPKGKETFSTSGFPSFSSQVRHWVTGDWVTLRNPFGGLNLAQFYARGTPEFRGGQHLQVSHVVGGKARHTLGLFWPPPKGGGPKPGFPKAPRLISCPTPFNISTVPHFRAGYPHGGH